MDTLTPKERSARMALIKGRDTKPELLLRQIVSALGYRAKLHYDLPGRPDFAFPKRRKVIQIHGCFWHRHRARSCPLARLPKSRLDFWLPKLEANRTRDLAKARELRRAGWKLLVIWECQLKDTARVARRISIFLEETHEVGRTVRGGRRIGARSPRGGLQARSTR
ncbi:very short patch repair endonuclease [Pyxidicoccus xibeiensis]|uniref:very short patch repair endonuclease n=1 Tax=Pyxidicoccus xibeiensis TaxID=2906759 RepID=UPI00389A1F49